MKKDDIERAIFDNAGVLRRLAQGNDALLKEYREGVERIAWCNENGRRVDEDFAQSVDELHDEIVRRMNGEESK